MKKFILLFACAVSIFWFGVTQAQTSSAGLKSASALLTDTPAVIIPLVSPEKFILTDVVVSFGNSATKPRVEIKDGSSLRLHIDAAQVPFAYSQSFINGLLFTENLSAQCFQCDFSEVFLTVSGKIVKK